MQKQPIYYYVPNQDSTAQTYTPNLFSLIPNDNIFQKYGNDTIGNGLIYGKHYGKGEFYASCNNGTYI
jgi:hypothetical protein